MHFHRALLCTSATSSQLLSFALNTHTVGAEKLLWWLQVGVRLNTARNCGVEESGAASQGRVRYTVGVWCWGQAAFAVTMASQALLQIAFGLLSVGILGLPVTCRASFRAGERANGIRYGRL